MRYDPDRVHHILWALTLLSFGVALLGLVGELLGWWNLVGEILMTAGTLAGLLLSGATLTQGASRDQVETVGRTLVSMDAQLDSVDSKLDSVDSKLDPLDSMDSKLGQLDAMDSKLDQLDSMDSKLDQLDSMDSKLDSLGEIKEAIDGEEGMTHELDAIQIQLDEQTGVLDRQVRVLEQIRDQA